MTITFSGSRTYDSEKSCVRFEVLMNGDKIACTIEEKVLQSLCDESNDALSTFDSCHMAILDYTRRKICDERNYISDRIMIR
ncbi:MAG: DUF1488 family protein [Rectinemataceae bacterium]